MGLRYNAAYVGYAVAVLAVATWVNTQVPNPYMVRDSRAPSLPGRAHQLLQDEIIHIPQAQAYCDGDWRSWDPRLTTPPGL